MHNALTIKHLWQCLDFISGGLGDALNGSVGFDYLVETGDVDMTLTQGTGTRNSSLAGGLGNDVLVRNKIESAQLTGGPSANVLDASAFTRNVTLFGLGGNDTLRGGNRADILVGGSTVHDTDVAALDAVLKDWTVLLIGYPTRVAHLLGTTAGSKSGPVRLNNTTVLDDGRANELTGSNQRDWFFQGTEPGLVNDLNTGGTETVTPLP